MVAPNSPVSAISSLPPPSRRFSSTGGGDHPPGSTALSSRLLASSTPHPTNRISSTSARQAGDAPNTTHQSSDHIDVLLDVLEEDPTPERLLDPTSGRPYPATISRISSREVSEGVAQARNPPLSLGHGFLAEEEDEVSDSELPPTSRTNDLSTDESTEQPRRPTTSPRAGTLNSTPNFPASPQDPVPRRCLALYDCEAENPDELTFRKDEVICIVRSVEPDWWEGYIEDAPLRRGLFPVPYIQLLPASK
ncbi:hypothetical protein AAHC03_024465 [Spirometra sp. Aus1]